jgi:hypothetical protein
MYCGETRPEFRRRQAPWLIDQQLPRGLVDAERICRGIS